MHAELIVKDQNQNFEYLKKSGICKTLSERQQVTESSTGAGSPEREIFVPLPISATNLHYISSLILEQLDNYRKQADYARTSSSDKAFSHANVKVLKFLCRRGKVI